MSREGPRRRKWLAWLLVGVPILLVAAVVAVPYAYIHLIEGKAAAPLSVDAPASKGSGSSSPGSSPSTTGGPADPGPLTTVDGLWNLASGSTAGYRVQEILLGQSNTAIGRTAALTGSLSVSGGTLSAGSFSADLTKVTSDQSRRDQQFQGRIMNTATYPTATFKITQPVVLGAPPADGTTVTKQVTGDLTLHGTTKSVTWPISIRRTGSAMAVSGSIPIVFADYGIANPSFGPVSTDNHGTLEFLLQFSHA